MAKRLIIILLVAFCLGLFLCWWTLFLDPEYDRPYARYATITPALKKQVLEDTQGMDYNSVVSYATDLTEESLSFARHNDIPAGKANCIGYAQLCSDICNLAFEANHIKADAKPVVGGVYLFGLNLCKVATKLVPAEYKSFVKDHDFVWIDIDGEAREMVDPTLGDLIGNSINDFYIYDTYINCR